MLASHYQREKEAYINVLENVQLQVNEYKQRSETLDTERGSWSKQINELKAELAETKATIVKMEELEKQNDELVTNIQAKELEIYKVKQESERSPINQMEQFKAELRMYQNKINNMIRKENFGKYK